MSAPWSVPRPACVQLESTRAGRFDDARALGDHCVLLRPTMGGEVEHLVLALAAEIEVEVGDHDLISKGLRFGDDPAIRVHDARAADQPRSIFFAGLSDRDRP